MKLTFLQTIQINQALNQKNIETFENLTPNDAPIGRFIHFGGLRKSLYATGVVLFCGKCGSANVSIPGNESAILREV